MLIGGRIDGKLCCGGWYGGADPMIPCGKCGAS
jgi:hypothetical protein